MQLEPDASPDGRETWRMSTMKWGKKKDPATGKNVADRTTINYNPKVTIASIPEDAERYILGPRSALAWIIDRYRVKTDKASGIVNDPNDWCDEHDNHRHVVDLIERIVTVSVETIKVVDSLADNACRRGSSSGEGTDSVIPTLTAIVATLAIISAALVTRSATRYSADL